tara:strand:- start:3148 stop:4128 length:981 start_codon:yes stop_codon:yes gene_type:complete
MNKQFNVGLIGYGYWGPNILRNMLKIQNIDVSCVIDMDSSKSDLISKTNFYTDIDDAINEVELDAVIISTPIKTHFDIAKKCLQSGINVLIQKPMAQTTEECDELIRIAKENNVKIMIAHTFLFTNEIKKIKELCSNGHLGTLKHLDSTRFNLGLFDKNSSVIWDLIPHDFSILNYLVGDEKPKFISASGFSHIEDCIDVASISVEYESGFTAHIHISWFSPIKIRTLLLSGDKRMLVYDDTKVSEKIMIYDKGVSYKDCYFDYRVGDMFSPKVDVGEAIEGEIKHFLKYLEGDECISGHNEGKMVVTMIEKVNESIKLGGTKVRV